MSKFLSASEKMSMQVFVVSLLLSLLSNQARAQVEDPVTCWKKAESSIGVGVASSTLMRMDMCIKDLPTQANSHAQKEAIRNLYFWRYFSYLNITHDPEFSKDPFVDDNLFRSKYQKNPPSLEKYLAEFMKLDGAKDFKITDGASNGIKEMRFCGRGMFSIEYEASLIIKSINEMVSKASVHQCVYESKGSGECDHYNDIPLSESYIKELKETLPKVEAAKARARAKFDQFKKKFSKNPLKASDFVEDYKACKSFEESEKESFDSLANIVGKYPTYVYKYKQTQESGAGAATSE